MVRNQESYNAFITVKDCFIITIGPFRWFLKAKSTAKYDFLDCKTISKYKTITILQKTQKNL